MSENKQKNNRQWQKRMSNGVATLQAAERVEGKRKKNVFHFVVQQHFRVDFFSRLQPPEGSRSSTTRTNQQLFINTTHRRKRRRGKGEQARESS
jgi:hypothetical protein